MIPRPQHRTAFHWNSLHALQEKFLCIVQDYTNEVEGFFALAYTTMSLQYKTSCRAFDNIYNESEAGYLLHPTKCSGL